MRSPELVALRVLDLGDFLTGLPALRALADPEIPETEGLPAWRDREHAVQRWCRLLHESGIPADPSRLELPVPDRRRISRVPGLVSRRAG
jgi:hypothetical protein